MSLNSTTLILFNRMVGPRVDVSSKRIHSPTTLSQSKINLSIPVNGTTGPPNSLTIANPQPCVLFVTLQIASDGNPLCMSVKLYARRVSYTDTKLYTPSVPSGPFYKSYALAAKDRGENFSF